jgi:hypothetical protein
MTEQVQPAAKKELTPDQILEREIHGMTNRKMSRRLSRIANSRGLKFKKSPPSNIDSTWDIVLSAVLDNTKPLGRMEPFLR